MYPNEKDPHPNWLNPGQGSYSSRDGAPAPPPGGYAPPPQQYPPPAQGGYGSYGGAAAAASSQYYPPPQGSYPAAQDPPPPDYGWAQSHPQGSQSGYDRKGDTYPSPPGPPPSNNPYAPGPPPPAGPSGGPPQEEGSNNGMSLAAFFGNKGPPPMWQRQPPPPSAHVPYNAFPPMCLISNSKELSKGFPEVPPPCQLNPHPFATHDVSEEDWKRFLADVKRGGSLTGGQRIKSNVLPMAFGMGFFSGFMMTNAIERKMKYKNRQAAGDVVDHWNHYFFGPRRMEVVLSQASERLSGKMGTAPVADPAQQRMASRLRQRGPDDSSDDDSSEEEGYQNQNQGHGFGGRGFGGGGFGRGGGGFGDGRRAGRRERRAERRARRAERREWKARGDNLEPYQLFITSV